MVWRAGHVTGRGWGGARARRLRPPHRLRPTTSAPPTASAQPRLEGRLGVGGTAV